MNSFVNNDAHGSTEIKRKSFWNYRLLQEEFDGDFMLSVVEVFYEDGVPTKLYNEINLSGFEDKRQIENAIGLLEGCLFKPVLYRDAEGNLKEKV